MCEKVVCNEASASVLICVFILEKYKENLLALYI